MQTFVPENLENPLKLFDKHYGKECNVTVRHGNDTKTFTGTLVAYNLGLGMLIIKNSSGRYVVFPNRNMVVSFELY